MHYAQSLPYADKLEHEAQDWLNDIRSNLVISIQAKDYTGGAVAWTKRLANYLDMKHAIPRETRAHLAKIYYEMLVMPGMNYALLELWSNTCVRLIKHKKRLDPEDLTLEWRPLYELICRSLFPKKRNAFLMAMHPVLRALGYMQRFFPANATKEILEEFLPRFTTHSPSDALLAQGYLVYFLPVDYQPQRTVQAQDYLPTIYSLWSMYTNSNAFDPQFLCFVAKIAKNQIEYGDNEIGVFSKQQVKSVFTYALRAFNLPVGSRSDGSGSAGGATTGYGNAGSRNDKKLGNAHYLGKKGPTVSRLEERERERRLELETDRKGHLYALSLLSDFIQATELYFHPSNHGMWSWWLTFFLRYLTSTFLSRWKEEQKEDCTTPQHRRLTPGIRREFVLTLRSVLYISMFGKDHAVVTLSQGSIKNLAWLEPGLIFPGLLERIYPSLETLTETHRTNSAINILKDIASPLICRENYPAGGKHLLPLLHLSIPGIDMNDPSKTLGSFFFISIALMSVPIIDMSQQQDGYYPTEEFIDDPHAELSRETEDYLVKATTGEFEEWLAKFMRRVFTIFENLPQENRKMQGRSSSNPTIETAITQTLLHACDTIFGQLSDDLYDLVLRMMVEFISDRVLPNAVRAVGLLCEAIAKANPKKAAKAFIPLCIANIQVELEHGAASTVTHAASSNLIQSDSTFHWYQNILFSVVHFLGPELLPYKQDVVSVAHAMVQQCRSRRGIMWTGKLLRNVLSTLLNVYPKDYRSVVPSLWNDKEYMLKHAHQLWGQPGDPANLEIDWHVPSDAEKNFALEFLAEFLAPAMQRLEELIEQNPANNHQVSNEFCRNLAIVRNCLMGSSAMVGDDGVSSHLAQTDAMMVDQDDGDGDDESIESMPEQHLEVGYAFSDAADPRTEQARTIRRSVGQLIHKLSDFFRSHREDDVESVKIWIKIARAFLNERGVEKSVFDSKKQNYSLGKDISKTPHCGKKYARNLLVRRAYNHHLLRLRQNNQSRLRTPLHDAILCDLLELSLGSYAEIRKLSQSALSATSRSFRDSKKLYIPVLLDALKPNVPSDRMKGALYLFSHKSILHPCLRDWSYIPTFIKAICRAQHQDKLTIQELLRDIHDRYFRSFNSFIFKTLTPDAMADYVKALSPATTQDPNFSKRVAHVEQRVNTRLEKNTAACREVMDFLLDFIQDPQVHWRFAIMSADFIKMLLKCEVSVSRRLAEFANTAAVSELPDMRDVGLRATTVLLLYIKQRTFAAGNEELLITGKTKNPLKVDIQVQDPDDFGMARRLLDATYQGLTPENAQESVLIDNMALGWYVWPSHYTGYKVNTNDFLFDTVAAECQEAYDEFQKTFSTSDYWRKICAYLSEEINPKENLDRFEPNHASLFKSIFQTFGDVPLTCAKEHIEKLCYPADQKNAQRAASEILAGLIRGTKHWSLAKMGQLWQWLTPLLGKVFSSITPDSLTYWESFVQYVTSRRDPRRIQPLIDLLLEAELDPTSDAAFNESRKLLLVRQVGVSLQWRFEPLIDRILPTYLNNIQHPYKQVREVIGVNINQLLQLEWIPSFPSVQRLLEANAMTDGVGNVPTTLTEKQQHRVDVLNSRLDAWLAEVQQNSASILSGSSDYAHASKTVLCWLHEAMNYWNVSGTLPYIVPMLPKIFAMQEINDDQDLQAMATRVLNLTAQVNYPSSMLPTLIDEFVKILTTSTNWHIRIRALPVLQIFFFKHLFVMTSAQLLRIMQVVGQLLLDTQIEVRQLASVTLGGLVRCSQRDAIQELLAEFTAKIQVKIPKRKRDKVTGRNVEPEGFAEAVLHKHAGVLGISSLINAFPYEVPEWMPAILCQLADCISDPAAEIQATIRKTFSDFRRTHSDTWHEDMLKFDEDQLSVLNDMLISPSYYA
ncbi:hypothetical protein MUCCIDRAFT_139775 [Mucor lusitanicus CBS 277.49]|uniref:ARM repeat-containing protein n=1 Tax=Mucor lusitanicus CBS 277.49 TaxID=747725 RepID=A0A168MI30_MUCCL|nr:hypothetical protein MUCCIDRAFT_139775 [Mucor lusitanicus CBS 277.49]